MASDPIESLAKLRLVKLSADLEVQLATRPGGSIAIEILYRLRDRAADSMKALALCNTEDPAEIRLLQNEVKRYDEWLVWLREVIADGREADREISEAEKEELLDLLMVSPDGQREAVALGLIDPGPMD